MNTFETILAACSGVRVDTKKTQNWRGDDVVTTTCYKTGDIILPDGDIFIEITATATKGTIAKVHDIEAQTYGECYDHYKGKDDENKIMTYDGTIIFEVDGRKQKGRIKTQYTKIAVGVLETKYVRDVKTHEKEEVKNPVNKYKQEMQVGDWVVGVCPGKVLGIGRITRWTNHNVWAIRGDDMKDKTKEFKFDSISETFTMADDEHVPLLTMAVLKGWTGR